MKSIVLAIILSIGFSACSGEFYELKKSPCACIDNNAKTALSKIKQKEVNKNVYL